MLQFKSTRIRDEYATLSFKNQKLFTLLIDLINFVEDNYKKDVMLTSILRTKEENDALYATTPIDKRPKSAPHTTWEAVDIRSSIYTKDEIRGILEHLNTKFKNANGKPSALYHMINGNVTHFHLYQRL